MWWLCRWKTILFLPSLCCVSTLLCVRCCPPNQTSSSTRFIKLLQDNLFIFLYYAWKSYMITWLYPFSLFQKLIVCEDEDWVVCLLWIQDLPRSWKISGQGWRQEPEIPVLQVSQGSPAEAQSSWGALDCPLQEEAQEGSGGGCLQEEEQENPEVPESCCWSHTSGLNHLILFSSPSNQSILIYE